VTLRYIQTFLMSPIYDKQLFLSQFFFGLLYPKNSWEAILFCGNPLK